LIEACRVPLNKLAKVNEEAESIIPAKKMPGVSIIVHSCEAGSLTTEYFNLDKAWCPGTQKFRDRLFEIE
jgi:hypothetical protein